MNVFDNDFEEVSTTENSEQSVDSDVDEVSIYDSIHEAYANDLTSSIEHANDYVATCVFKSYDCPEVFVFRRYRDMFLGSTWHGKLTVKLYYLVSPLLVKCLKNATKVNGFFYKLLSAKAKRMHENGVDNSEYEDKNIF